MTTDVHTKLAKIAGEIGPINKDEQNKEQGFKFRSIEAITDKARPLLAKEGISVMPRVLSREYSEITARSGARGFRCIAEVEYTFTAGSDGSTAVASMIGEAVDYGDKSTSKAVQMAYKYVLTQVLAIGSGDDPDSLSPEAGHVETVAPPFDAAAYTRDAMAMFGEWSDKERADSFKKHSQALLGGKPVTPEEVRKVIEAVAADYYAAFPGDTSAPF